MKRLLHLLAFVLFVLMPLGADDFPSYDLTLFPTIRNSIAIMDSETFGFDYTAYGFVGKKATTGLYLRIGVQTPFKTLQNIFFKEKQVGKDNEGAIGNTVQPDSTGDVLSPGIDIPSFDTPSIDVPSLDTPSFDITPSDTPSIDLPSVDIPTIDTPSVDITLPDAPSLDTDSSLTPPVGTEGSSQLPNGDITMESESNVSEDSSSNRGKGTKLNKDYRLSFSLGPAFRHFISEDAIWYLGMGINIMLENRTISEPGSTLVRNTFSTRIATDLDTGFKVSLTKSSSIRFGINIGTNLFTFVNTGLFDHTGKLISEEKYIDADVFTPIGAKTSTEAVGYIGLATTISSRAIKKYKYTITSAELNEGKLEEIIPSH